MTTRMVGAAQRWRRIGVSAVIVAGFVTSVLFSLLIGRAGGQFAPIWTANGFLAGGLILLPRAWSASVGALCLAAQVIVGLFVGDGLVRALADPLVNLVEAGLAAWLAVRFCGARARRLSLREMLLLPVCAIVPAAIVGGLLGAAVNAVMIGQEPMDGWANWAIPDGFGMVIVLPALLLMTRIGQYREFYRSPWEVAAITLGLFGLCAVLFLGHVGPLQFLIYPALTLVAFRLGPPGVAIAGALVALVVLPLVILGHGAAAHPGAPALAGRMNLAELAASAMLFTTLATAGALSDQMRLRRMMLWRDQAARAARRRARCAELLVAEALAAAPLAGRRDAVRAG